MDWSQWSGYKPLATLVVFPKEFFEKVNVDLDKEKNLVQNY